MRVGRTLVSSVAMLAVASAVGLTGGIRAQDKAGRTKPGADEAGDQLDEKASREVMQALQQVRAAVRKRDQGDKEKAKAEEAKAPLPTRPTRSVTPPSLTSADLDRMIQKYLAKTNPKVEPAELTSDVEFVRRVHLDLAGAPPTPGAGPLLRQRPDQGQAGQADRRAAAEPRVRPQLGAVLARRGPVPRHQPERDPGAVRRPGRLAGRAVPEEPAVGRDRLGDDHGHRDGWTRTVR